MKSKSGIINILTYRLPYDLANQIFNEYQARLLEANYLIENYQFYSSLRENRQTVESILALSIFYKRIMSCFDGAIKFHEMVADKSGADIVKIGSYSYTSQDSRRMLSVILDYSALIKRYRITADVMEYYETKELLKNLVTLMNLLDEFEQ